MTRLKRDPHRCSCPEEGWPYTTRHNGPRGGPVTIVSHHAEACSLPSLHIDGTGLPADVFDLRVEQALGVRQAGDSRGFGGQFYGV